MSFHSRFRAFLAKNRSEAREVFIAVCMTANLYSALMLSEKYTLRFIGVTGPSMVPTLDSRDNLIMVDCFTLNFLRGPHKGEVVLA